MANKSKFKESTLAEFERRGYYVYSPGIRCRSMDDFESIKDYINRYFEDGGKMLSNELFDFIENKYDIYMISYSSNIFNSDRYILDKTSYSHCGVVRDPADFSRFLLLILFDKKSFSRCDKNFSNNQNEILDGTIYSSILHNHI